MNFQTYQQEALRTFSKLSTTEDDIKHCALGIITEVGEFADIFKKNLAYGKPLDPSHINEEYGDICWYVAILDSLLKTSKSRFLTYNEIESELSELYEAINMKEEEILYNCSYFINRTLHNNSIVPMLYYLAILAKVYNVDLDNALEKNVSKLKVRYENKFSSEEALNRNLEKEKQALS